jgi:hypothetical protein
VPKHVSKLDLLVKSIPQCEIFCMLDEDHKKVG